MVQIISLQKQVLIKMIKNPEMLGFIPGHLRTKKMCKHAVKKLSFLLK